MTLEAPEGFSTWYQKEAWIRVVSEDGAWGSQVDTVTCYVGNKIIGKSKEDQSEFLITQTSKSGEGVPVTVTVTDQAGNKTEKTQKLFIGQSGTDSKFNRGSRLSDYQSARDDRIPGN